MEIKSIKYFIKGLEYENILNVGCLFETKNLYNKDKLEIIKFINR